MVVRELLIALGFNLDESKLKRADQGLNNIKRTAETAISTIGRMAAVIGLALGAGEVVKMSDEWTNIDARIGLVTKSVAEQAEMQQEVFEIAQKTRQEYGATGDLFFKLSRAAGQLGASQQDVLDVTETVNKALVVGGASTQEAQATILQLSQALASGRLQGDELRSLSENASMLMDEVAKYYSTTIGGLKQMGKDGELTAEGVFAAILKAKLKMDKEFEKMPVTIGQAVTFSINRIGMFIFGLNKETGVFQRLARSLMRAVDWFADSVERAIKAVGGWQNVINMGTWAMTTLGATMLALKWDAVIAGVRSLRKALLSIAVNPSILALAVVIGLIVLALQDLYTWTQGGKSIFGEMVGEFSEWESTLKPLNDLLSELGNLLKEVVAPNMDLVTFAVKTLTETVEYLLMPFALLLKLIKAWQEFDVKSFIGEERFNQMMQANLLYTGGWKVLPESMGRGVGNGPVSITNSFDFNQLINTNQSVPNAVRGATLNASEDAVGPLVRGLENYVFGD